MKPCEAVWQSRRTELQRKPGMSRLDLPASTVLLPPSQLRNLPKPPMPHVIVDLPSAPRRKQDADPTALSRQVWQHDGLAKEQGLHPVVELYSHKSKTCKRLSKLWKKNTQLRDDTLDGIYLIRVNLLEHGPKAVLLLTHRVVLGVPLFVAWNPLGQVLSPREFAGFDDSELEQPLSAFFEDVVAGQPFRLAPVKKEPRERHTKKPTAPAQSATDAATPSSDATKTHAATPKDAEPDAATKTSTTTPSSDATKTGVATPKDTEPRDATEAEPAASSEEPAAQAPRPASELDQDVEQSPLAPDPNVVALSRQLDVYLEKAGELAEQYLAEHELLTDHSLESLVDLDVHIREYLVSADAPAEAQRELQKIAGALAVYLGETIRACSDATWYVDQERSSLVQALRLRVQRRNDREDVAPAQIVLDALTSRSDTLFGRVAQLSGLLDSSDEA